LFAQSRAEQERTRAVVDATNDAIVMLDEHRRPLLVNRRARFFFGFTERDLAGRSFDEIGSLFTRMFEDSQRFRSWLTQLLGSQTERAVEEFRILSPEPRLLQCYSAPVTDLHERYLGRLLVFRDITREREVERMKNDFVSTVSHELRTPLASIQGALQLVLGPPGGGGGMALGMAERGRELLSISLSNTERLIRMINDILDIAKIEQGRVELRREALNPAELCRAAAAEMSAFADAREITLEVQAAPWLPRVLADRDRAVQILVNLLSNAVKFSPPGQRVLLRARSEGQLVCFTVQDWGRGVASEHQPQLFQKFQQLDSSATRTVGGTGLGLAISKALVEEQGGRIWLESQPGEGSSFSFTLPLAPPGALGGPEARPLLALFEPNAELRAKLGAALRAEGWDVRELTTPDALDEADAPPVAMALVGPSLAATDPTIVGQLRAAGMLAPLLLLGTASGEAARGVAWMPWPAPVAEVAARALRLRAEHEPYVLVVDDDPYVRPVLVRLLQRHALRVASASDGFSALSMVEQQLPDVILLDIQMPGLSGFEVLRRLKAQERTAQIPVIILTANDLSEPARAQGHALGASAYLEKPVAYERLVSAVWVALGRPEDGS
jgi:PAS domain S-box-containing protein